MKWIVIAQWCHFAQYSNCISLIPSILISVTSVWPHFRDNLKRTCSYIFCLIFNISFSHRNPASVRFQSRIHCSCLFWASFKLILGQLSPTKWNWWFDPKINQSSVLGQDTEPQITMEQMGVPSVCECVWMAEHDEHVGTLHRSLCHRCVR